MLLRTFVTLLLVTAFQNGEFSNMAFGTEKCMELIQEGGDIACNLTGQGNYEHMSIGNCWVTCTEHFADFYLPHVECERVLALESWAGFQKEFGSLPPYRFESCGDEDQRKLRNWVDKWKNLKTKSKDYLCSHEKKSF
uniref:Ixodes 10 kDa peptide protein n=1 Tax=Ixodes ricinus TaxID=34613 RepID=V5IIF9_IXORI